nr:gustatory receptor 4 [Graphosoma rubrolineatum]
MYFSSESVLNLIFLLTKLLGVFPYDHVRKRVSYQWFTYSLIIILVCTVEAAFVVFDPPRLAKNSLLRNILFRCQMLAMYACIVIFNGCILIHRRKISLVFLILDKLKNETRGQPSLLLVLSYLFWQSLAIAATAYMDWVGNTPLEGTVSLALVYYYGMISIIVAGIAPFVALVQLVSVKLEYLVIALKSRVTHSTGRLYSCVLLYDRMVSLLNSLNESFSLQLLLISFVSFFNLTINMFFIADYVVNEASINRSKMVPVYLGWITIFSSMIIFPVYSCHRTIKQAKEFNTQLYQLMIDDTTNDISNNKKLRLHIAMKREVVFTACGFFTLDYTLVHSMIAAATTYLVILIQFGQRQPTGSESLAYSTPFSNSTESPLSPATI